MDKRWQDLLWSMKDRGWGVVRIAKNIGVSQGQLYKLRSGRTAEPRYSVGVKLIRLEERTRPENPVHVW